MMSPIKTGLGSPNLERKPPPRFSLTRTVVKKLYVRDQLTLRFPVH